MTNIIYITKSSKRKLIKEFNSLSICSSNSNIILTFHKKNTKAVNILNIFFPKVLKLIIIQYCIEIIEVYVNMYNNIRWDNTHYYFNINIPKYKYNGLTDAACHMPEYNKTDYKIIMWPALFNFGKQLNIHFKYFNEFMRKNYNKINYFVGCNLEDDYYNYGDVYIKENHKQLKYCLIITKILFNIIQYSLKHTKKK